MRDSTIKKGIYLHYKNKYYEVLDIARHSETLEEMVFYRMLADDFSLWVRPLSMFIEDIDLHGKRVPRFKFISSQTSQDFLKNQKQ